jgi:hypothetical protein
MGAGERASMFPDHTLLRRLLNPNRPCSAQVPPDHLIWVNSVAHLRTGAVSLNERELSARRMADARTELERLTA